MSLRSGDRPSYADTVRTSTDIGLPAPADRARVGTGTGPERLVPRASHARRTGVGSVGAARPTTEGPTILNQQGPQNTTDRHGSPQTTTDHHGHTADHHRPSEAVGIRRATWAPLHWSLTPVTDTESDQGYLLGHAVRSRPSHTFTACRAQAAGAWRGAKVSLRRKGSTPTALAFSCWQLFPMYSYITNIT